MKVRWKNHQDRVKSDLKRNFLMRVEGRRAGYYGFKGRLWNVGQEGRALPCAPRRPLLTGLVEPGAGSQPGSLGAPSHGPFLSKGSSSPLQSGLPRPHPGQGFSSRAGLQLQPLFRVRGRQGRGGRWAEDPGPRVGGFASRNRFSRSPQLGSPEDPVPGVPDTSAFPFLVLDKCTGVTKS